MAKADFGKAKQIYESTAMGEQQWLAAFDSNPDIMWSILADIYNVVKDEEEREAGKKRMGRRPTRAASSIDELMNTVMPAQFDQEPFPEALRKLLIGKSQTQFARRVPCAQSTVSRLLSGEMEPDIVMLERVAVAAKVPPHFFIEYRAAYVSQLVQRVLTERPNLGVKVFKRLQSVSND